MRLPAEARSHHTIWLRDGEERAVPEPTDVPTHVELLGFIGDLQAAAASSDRSDFVSAVQRFRSQLERHVAAEREDHRNALPDGVERALQSGQERLLALAAGIEAAASQDGGTPRLVRVAELAAVLRHQADLERRTTMPGVGVFNISRRRPT